MKNILIKFLISVWLSFLYEKKKKKNRTYKKIGRCLIHLCRFWLNLFNYTYWKLFEALPAECFDERSFGHLHQAIVAMEDWWPENKEYIFINKKTICYRLETSKRWNIFIFHLCHIRVLMKKWGQKADAFDIWNHLGSRSETAKMIYFRDLSLKIRAI